MFATKLQGASLFLLICRDLQDSVLIQEERTRAGDALGVPVSVRHRGIRAALGRPCRSGTVGPAEPALELVAAGRTGGRGTSARRRGVASLADPQVRGLRLPRLLRRCTRGQRVGLGTDL